MTEKELNDAYFEWMYQLVCDDRYSKRSSYRQLLSLLHNVDFRYSIAMDDNRAADGVDLRYRFGYECNHEDAKIAAYLDNRPCSVLEMMVALAMRCEENIMNDPDVGDRIGQWFWTMIVNLGLGSMRDEEFDKDYTTEVIFRFLDRKYKRNGSGGLFMLEHSERDMRQVEIWHQMCWYLDDILEN